MTSGSNKSSQVDRIYSQMEQSDFQAAGKLCQTVTSRYPDYAEGWVAAAEFFLRVTNPQRALAMANEALKLDRRNINWMLLNARCLMECGHTLEMKNIISEVTAHPKLTSHQHNEIGMLLARIDDHADAQCHYKLAVAAKPGEIEFLFNLATSQRFLGEIEAAEKTLDLILEADPTDHEAAAMRSSLRKQTAENNHIESLKRVLATDSLNPASQVSFSYALAKELEDLESYSESFSYLKRGADLRRSGMRYEVSTDVEIMNSIAEVFDRDFFALNNTGHDSKKPIFIIGLPRSGTTLLERILGSHNDVHAAGELGNFGTELTKLTRQSMVPGQTSRRQFVAASAKIDFRALGQNYIDSTRPLTGSTPRFIDKLPFNYLYAGLIQNALPRAKIISMKRHPMDSCYSMYKQLFRDAYPFSYSQQDLSDYYIAYHRLMTHWENVIPGTIHHVAYEDLVSQTEDVARRVLAWCGLDWDARCLEFHKNTSASTTASATQIRQKVYSSSVGKWTRYETELMPLRRSLETAGLDLSIQT